LIIKFLEEKIGLIDIQKEVWFGFVKKLHMYNNILIR
jgi:hypothetical protein